MALLQIRRGNNGTKGTLQYGEPFFNSTLQTVQFGASGSEEITLVKLSTGLAGANTWGSASVFENQGSLSVTGDITASNAYLRGNLVVSGNIILGNLVSGQTTSSDSITVVADFTSDLIPNESASYNLGSATNYWNTAYVGSLSLATLAGADAVSNIVYVNAANQLTASNDFEYIEGARLRLGSGSQDRFWVEPNTGNTFASGNLYVSGTTGIILKGNVSSSAGTIFGISGAFANLNPSWNPSAADNGLVFTQGGSLVNTSKIRYFEAQEQLNIGNGKFIIDGTNGNTFTSGTLHALGQFSGSSAVLTETLQVGGAANFNNQVNVATNLVVTDHIRAGGSGSFGNGITVTGSVVLNAGGGGFVHVSGNTQLGDNPQTDELSISGSVTHLFTGTALQNVFRRYSAVKSSSIIFDDDNSIQVPGLGPNLGKILIRQQSADGLLDSHTTTNVTSSGIVLSGPGGVGSIRVGYANVATASSIKVELAATDGILLNSRTQLASNLSVTGSTILAGGLITTASNILITGVGANQGNIQNFNTASFGLVNVSSSLYVTGSTTILGELKIGDLTTSASGLIEGSASIAGDLTVRGNAVYLGVDRISTDANLIEIGSGSTIPSQVEGAGLFISGASAQFIYKEVGDRMFLNKGLKIEGDSVSGFGLQVSASTYLSGNLEVSGNLDVYGNINLGNVTITNTASIQELIVNNNISGGNNLNLANNASISGNLYVFGTETVNGQLKANSATALHSTLNVSGAVGLNNVLRVTGSTAITGGLFVSGNTELSSSLIVKEYSFFEKNMRVSGNLQVDGNLEILGDVTQLQVSNLQIEDKNIILASGSLSSLQSDDAGLTILGPTTPIQFTWDHTNQRMNLNKDFNVETNLLVAGDNIIDTAVALAIALG
jgi:cytoskeletal protein CcmA (bactofilin family)